MNFGPPATSFSASRARFTLAQVQAPRGSGLKPALHSAGFTLAEVLAALVFMAILILVALEGLSIASRAGEVAARKSVAALVGERSLIEIIVCMSWTK